MCRTIFFLIINFAVLGVIRILPAEALGRDTICYMAFQRDRALCASMPEGIPRDHCNFFADCDLSACVQPLGAVPSVCQKLPPPERLIEYPVIVWRDECERHGVCYAIPALVHPYLYPEE